MKRLAASHARQRPTPAARGRTTAAFVPSPNDVPLTAARTAAARTARTVRALCPAEVAGFGSASRTMTSDTGAPAEVHARAGVEAGGRLGVVVVEPLAQDGRERGVADGLVDGQVVDVGRRQAEELEHPPERRLGLGEQCLALEDQDAVGGEQ